MTECLELVDRSLKLWPQPEPIGDGNTVVIHTQSLYPSMSVVKVFVECTSNAVRVSDGGGALLEVTGVGEYQFDALKMLQAKSSRFDLDVSSEGWLWSKPMPHANLADLVAWVATASHRLASELLSHVSARPKVGNFRAEVDAFLTTRYPKKLQRNKAVVGASNKTHKFDYFLSLNGAGKGLLIDVVTNDMSSINSAVVSHLDVAKAEPDNIVQRVIYDDRDEWKSADLNLLRVGATPLAFTKVESALARAIHLA